MRFRRNCAGASPGAGASRRFQAPWRSTGADFASARLLRARHIPAPPASNLTTAFDRTDLMPIAVVSACRRAAPASARAAAEARVAG
ncbi:MAG TPA: hypothetical protein VJR48_01530 [Ktedonobacterales bacterium]|nr:hypothetical protein [Ktedonobacterales bacterium]